MMQCAWKGAALLYGISAGAHTDHGVVIAGYSIELVVHAPCSACIRVKRIVHFAGGRSLSHFARPEGRSRRAQRPNYGSDA